MAEALQPAIRIHGELAAEFKRPGIDRLPCPATRGKSQVLIDQQLGDGEAVVHLGVVDLFQRVLDAGLLVRHLRREIDTADMGKVIGKNGKIIRAIRNVIKIPAIKQNKKINVTLGENSPAGSGLSDSSPHSHDFLLRSWRGCV
ncbi:MAG: KH domain-containing protein [Nitrospinae bacterium]|nr:KH domain-containing protein [Nitrospinota bacterium]